MASRIFDRLWVLGKDRKDVTVRFFPQGTSNPVVNAKESAGVASVVRNGAAGVFLITLSNEYRNLVGFEATVQHTTAAALFAQLGDVSNLGSADPVTAVVRVVNGSGTGTDITANANSSVSVTFKFDDSKTRE